MEDGYHLSLANLGGFSHIYALENLPLVSLDLSGTNVSNLYSLKGMPLKRLNISNTNVVELRGLEDMKLQYFDFSGTGVKNINILRGMPLKVIHLGDAKVNLKVLEDFPELELLVLPEGLYEPGYLNKIHLKAKIRIRK